MNRDLDRLYFRIERDGKWQKICFSDLTDEEMDIVLFGHTAEWLKKMCKILGHTIRDIGDAHDFVGWQKDEEEE
nr:MAG TPA: hypothetical protein [Caudoviricetes sp.]